MWGRAFWKDAAERAISTFAEALVALLAVDGVNLLALDWPESLGVAGTAAALSVLKSLAAAKVGDTGTASLVSTGRHALDGTPRAGQDHELPATRLVDPRRDRL